MIRPACKGDVGPSQRLERQMFTQPIDNESGSRIEHNQGRIIRRIGDRLVIETPAKINLHLEVLGKRADGYHELETLLVAVTLYDTLTFAAAESGTELACDDPDAGPSEANLVVRAVELVRRESGKADGIKIELKKQIPVAAGLAGGSSDAAATLVALNKLWKLNWPLEWLAQLAEQLGSDVPFFLHGPAAVAKGRGEKLETITLGAPLHLVLVAPPRGLSTALVFGKLTVPKQPVPLGPMVDAVKLGDVTTVAKLLHNRLQAVSAELSPAVADLQTKAQQWPCLGHLMSGSGSAYFAVCESALQAESLGRQLRGENVGSVFVVRSCMD